MLETLKVTTGNIINILIRPRSPRDPDEVAFKRRQFGTVYLQYEMLKFRTYITFCILTNKLSNICIFDNFQKKKKGKSLDTTSLSYIIKYATPFLFLLICTTSLTENDLFVYIQIRKHFFEGYYCLFTHKKCN